MKKLFHPINQEKVIFNDVVLSANDVNAKNSIEVQALKTAVSGFGLH